MKGITLSLLMVSLLLLASCGGNPSTDAEQRGIFGLSKSDRVDPNAVAFVGGTGALKGTFTPGNPPQSVFTGTGEDADDFNVEILVENGGEAFVGAEEVVVRLEGIDPIEFGKQVEDFTMGVENDLYPRLKDPSTGKEIPPNPTYAKFEGLLHAEPVIGNINFPVRVSMCYPYETKVLTDLCVRSNLRSLEQGVCNPQGDRKVQNSGAPIQITSFTQSVQGPKEISVVFKIQHRGPENLYSPESSCEFDRTNQNKVLVELNTGGLHGLSCIGLRGGQPNQEGEITSGFVELRNGEATVGCTLRTGDADFVKGITAKLSYMLKHNIETSVTVKSGITS